MYSASSYEECFYANHLILILQLWIYVKYFFPTLHVDRSTGPKELRNPA